MAIPSPQTELPRNGIGLLLSGGSDAWDDGLLGSIISDEYFDEPAASNKMWIKVGGTWKEATTWIKVAGVWKTATPKTRVGGAWQ